MLVVAEPDEVQQQLLVVGLPDHLVVAIPSLPDRGRAETTIHEQQARANQRQDREPSP